MSDSRERGAGAAESDRALLRRYHRRGDLDAFDALVDRYERECLRLASALLRDGHGAADVVQDAFVRLAEQVERVLRGMRSERVGGWLATVVRNGCVDRLRRGEAVVLALAPDALPAPEAPPLPADDEARLLWQAVDRLSPLQRAVVVLRFRDGLSYRGIADALDKTISHVGVVLHEALAALRRSSDLRREVQP